jgi:hypothetical protein
MSYIASDRKLFGLKIKMFENISKLKMRKAVVLGLA